MSSTKRAFLELDRDEKKSRWTKEEDEKMLALVKKYGRRWTMICSHLPGRSDNAVKNRYHTFFRPAEEEEGPAKKQKITKSKTKPVDETFEESPTLLANPCYSTQLPTLPDEGGLSEDDVEDKDDDDYYNARKSKKSRAARQSSSTRRGVSSSSNERNCRSAETEAADETPTIAHKFAKSFDECHLTANSSPVVTNSADQRKCSDQDEEDIPPTVQDATNQQELLMAAYRIACYHYRQQQLLAALPLPCFQELCDILVKDKLLSPSHQDEDMLWLRNFLTEQLRVASN